MPGMLGKIKERKKKKTQKENNGKLLGSQLTRASQL